MSDKVRIVRNSQLEAGPPTAGMVRKTALSTDEVWVGEVRTEAGAVSAWHHHGEHTTRGYVVSGKLRFEFGQGGSEAVEASPGDFFEVPPHTIHRESNPADEEQVLVGVRIGKGPTVFNVEGPES